MVGGFGGRSYAVTAIYLCKEKVMHDKATWQTMTMGQIWLEKGLVVTKSNAKDIHILPLEFIT